MAHEQPLYNEADHQLIEDYLDGILSEEDRKMVEDRLQSDSDFAVQFQLHQDIEGVLDAHEKTHIKARLGSFDRGSRGGNDCFYRCLSLKVASKSSQKSSFHWLKVAAIVLMFLLPAALYLGDIFNPNTTSPQELAMQNFVAPNVLIEVSRGGEDAVKSVVALQKSIQVAYKNKAYQRAFGFFGGFAENKHGGFFGKYFTNLFFQRGFVNFLLKDYNEAAHNFLKVNPTDGIQSKANWYLALTYLQLSDIEKAKALLSEIEAANECEERT